MNIETSKTLFERAKNLAPAGVHSPVRAFQSVGGTPIFFEKGEGANLWDVDGNKYTDFCMSWGALALGHAHPLVVKHLQNQASLGTHYGTPTKLDVELAEEALKALEPFDRIRFVNSGTEAVMTAIRLARGITGRDLVVKIDGAYHGHVDSLLVAAGSGLVTQGVSSSKGIPKGFADSTLVIPYGSEEALREVFNERGREIAAIIVEPVMANNGLFDHGKNYLDLCRKLSKAEGSLLIFDEVITGFRVGWGGVKKSFEVDPDIGTYGKVIGGGMPIGAIAGKKEVIENLAPTGDVYQAGTLSGNPLAMSAGLTTLKVIQERDFYNHIKEIGSYFDEKIVELRNSSQLKFSFKRIDSIFWFSFGSEKQPLSPKDISAESAGAYKEVYHHLLEKGIYMAPSAYEVGFLSLAHQREHIDLLMEALKEV